MCFVVQYIIDDSQYKLSHEVTDLIWVYIRVMQVDMHDKMVVLYNG